MTNESAASDSQAVPSSLEGAKILDVSKITQDTSNPCVLEVDDIADTLNAPVSIDRPTPGQSSEVSLKPGTNYLFDFAESDVSSLVESCGNLVMSFQDGATLTLANFSETISADIPSMLAFTGELIGAEGEVDEAGDGEIVNISNTIETPSEQADFEEPQTEIRATQPKQESVQQVIEESVQHTSVSITGQMQSQRLVISDEATAEELMALSLANIEPAAGEASSTPNLAQSLANIEPAAGEAAGSEGNTGFGFGSSFDPRGVIPLNDVGPINPTALQYGITLPDIDLLIQDEEQSAGNTNDTPVIVNPASPLLDESNLGPNTLTGLLDIDFGNDQPGDIFANNNFSVSGSVLNGALTSGGNDIDVTESATGYVGTINNGSEIVFEFILDQDTGGYEFNQYLPFDHADGNNPDDEITLSFGVEATDIDGDAATTEVIVKIADDAPVANDDNNSASESETVTGNILGNDDGGVDTPVNIVEFDGQSIPVNGLTVNGNYGVLTIQQDGSYSYTANSNNPEGVDSFSYTIIDFDGDRSTAQLTIDVTAIDDNPIVDPITESIDESDLSGGDIIVNGNLNPDYGTDGPGAVTPVDFASSGSRLNNALTSNGVPVDVQLVGTTYTGTANGEIIFTMDVQPDGSYTFTLIGALDHADGNNPDDIINLEFTVNATDQDNDVSQTVITIEVADDVPSISSSGGSVDETDFNNGALEVNGALTINSGADDSTISPNGMVDIQANGQFIALTSNGDAVTITPTTNGYEGTTNGGTVTIFTLDIDPLTGQYAYSQSEPLDHPDGNDANDTIDLFFDFDITNTDGDSETGTITISVSDDGVNAVDDTNSADEGNTITGTVTGNDGLSEDSPNIVTNVAINGTNYPVSAGNPAVVTTSLGTLTLNSDGSYTYEATDLGDPDGVNSFTYTLVDNDGDTDTATLAIRVSPDGEPVPVNEEFTIDETSLTTNNPLEINDTLNVDFGLDGAGSISPNGTVTPGGSLAGSDLFSGGVRVIVTPTANGYEGVLQGTTTTVFELTIQNDGAYTFALFQSLDHADINDPNDEINIEFGITIADANGDTVDGTLTIKIADDAPVANDDSNSASESETVTGNILGNDDGGVDTPVNIVEFDGQSIPVNGLTVNGNYGVLTIQQDGSYSYTANSNNPEGVDSFSYTIIDFDGDRSTAQLTIDVTAIDDNPIVDPITESIDESDLSGGDIIVNGNLNPDYGTDGPGAVTPVDFASSGSRLNNALTSNGVPVDVQLVGTTYTGTANGEIIFTMDVQPDGSYTFTLIGALDHADGNNPDDIINLEFTVNATDQDNDVSQTVITIEVADDAPVANDDSNVVEQNQNDVSGNVTDNDIFGVDETHIVTAISFNGNEVPVDITNGATINGDHGVLTINIDGSYTYISNGTNVSVVEDVFTYSLMDFDGDIDKAELVITINDIDDKPTVDVRPLSVDETDIDPTDIDSDTATGSFGNDGPGAFAVTGVNTFTVVSGAANNALTSGGVPVEVNVVNGQYVGTANQETIFTFDIDAQTGEYTFTLIGTLDHADTNDPNDNIVLTFGVDAVDQDGDIASALVTVNVFDDAPVAVYDCVEFNGYIGRLESNVIENDNLGSDRPASVTQVSFGANSVDVPANGTTTIDGDFGSLEIAADGSYTYRLFDVPNINTIGSFATFIATPSDLDGFQSSITLDGITVTSVNGGDLVYGDRGKDGTGVGIQDGTGSDNVFGNDEALDVSFDPASEVTLAISEIGDNNSDGTFGVDYEITFEDGSTLISEQQFVPGEIVGGTISFTLSSDDFGGKLITNVTLSSTNAGSFKRASFLLNSVEVEYPVDTPDNTKDKFVYTLTDYDGDTDEAILKIKADYDDTTIQTANDNGVLFGTDDADIFVFDQIDQDIDTVKDFDLTDGDVIDVTQIIGQANATQDAIDDFVFARNVSGDTELSIDINGSGDASNAIPLAIIEDVNDLDLGQALKTTSGIV